MAINKHAKDLCCVYEPYFAHSLNGIGLKEIFIQFSYY